MEMKAATTTAQPQPPSGGLWARLVAAAGGMFSSPSVECKKVNRE